ncbi:predicted protein [Chaetoceros tenuissimus]|uniref:Uncharacterized protein n=1 Tax=Chaetoceros tenuissimus TaxID=426638 RepID=A0AAD3CI37_9STRA|nr:predicted protein [Chaetoceros tenuissimus]
MTYPNSYFDEFTGVTCGEVERFLSFHPTSTEICDYIQYRGVVNCGCFSKPVENISCRLCKNENETILNRFQKVTLANEKESTCGALEFILAMDIDNEFDAETCDVFQSHFEDICLCGTEFNETNVPYDISSSPTLAPSIIQSMVPSQSMTNDHTKMVPSRRPSFSVAPSSYFKPNLSHEKPSITSSTSPTSILERDPNCTALQGGVIPSAYHFASRLEMDIRLNIFLTKDNDISEDDLFIILRNIERDFTRYFSLVFSGCKKIRRKLSSSSQWTKRILFFQLENATHMHDFNCAKTNLVLDMNEKAHCRPIKATGVVYFWVSEVFDDIEEEIQKLVQSTIEELFPSLVDSIPSLTAGELVTKFSLTLNSSEKNMRGRNIVIGIGIASVTIALISAVVVLRRTKEDSTSVTTKIIPESHLRSDDSISNDTFPSNERIEVGCLPDGNCEIITKTFCLESQPSPYEYQEVFEANRVSEYVLKDLFGHRCEMKSVADTIDL